MEGLGGEVSLDHYNLDGIDPTLEDCCRREVCEKIIEFFFSISTHYHN